MAIHRLNLSGIVANDASGSARQAASVTELNDRAREVLRLVVESYVETGDPVNDMDDVLDYQYIRELQ